jgi:hypothetical protein
MSLGWVIYLSTNQLDCDCGLLWTCCKATGKARRAYEHRSGAHLRCICRHGSTCARLLQAMPRAPPQHIANWRGEAFQDQLGLVRDAKFICGEKGSKLRGEGRTC